MGYDFTDCRLCPRDCGVNRKAGETGYCGETKEVRVALATRHFGEEPPLTGTGGSGAVFFSGCTLGCSFCQNCQLSGEKLGRPVDSTELARIFLTLEEQGAENINLVTGTHYAPQIAGAVEKAKNAGCTLPFVWNTSAYESIESLSRVGKFADIYVPDLKTLDPDVAANLFNAPDYPNVAMSAIRAMASLGPPAYSAGGAMISGTIVRHLVLPGMVENTRKVLSWISEYLGKQIQLSLMFQYMPPKAVSTRVELPDRTVEDIEYYQVMGMLDEFEIDDGFVQEPDHDSQWFPDFKAANPFPESHSRVVWHWAKGFVG